MFRKKDPQGSLFETSALVPAAKRERLQASWAEPFRARALQLIADRLVKLEVLDSISHERVRQALKKTD